MYVCNTEELITNASKAVKDITLSIRLFVHKVTIQLTSEGVETSYGSRLNVMEITRVPLMYWDIFRIEQSLLSYLAEIIERSGRINDILVNPQLFIDLCCKPFGNIK